MKICTTCNLGKEINEFYKDKTHKDGYTTKCKICKNNISKIYKQNNPTKIKGYYNKKVNLVKQYREINKGKIKQQNHEWYINNKVKNNLNSKKWRINNKIKSKEINKKSKNKRILKDPIYVLQNKIRNIINKSFKLNGHIKKPRTHEILGCSFEEFKQYLESKFESWMNWDNHGLYNGELDYGWDIDHRIPISSAKTEEDVIRLSHFSNLQPLCSKVNRYIKRDN